jgi:hypothetical protein
MDPAGIREILLVRPYVANPYQIEAVARHLPYKTRIRGHYSNIPWLPLSEPLTQRVSNRSEGYAGFGQYDCLVIAGTDLESCTERDIQHIRSAMERGLPVLVCGGAYGLGSSYRLWHDLEGCLPVRIPAKAPESCEGEVRAAEAHPVLRGLPASFGRVTAIHPVEPAPDAQVVLTANGRPLLVAGQRFGSRQLVLAVAAADGLWCDGLETQGFYGHPFYADLMRQALTWLMRVEVPLRLDSLVLETGLRLDQPGAHVFHTVVRQDGAVAGERLRCSVYGVDEARLMAGGDAAPAEKRHEEVRPVSAALQKETFRLEDPQPGKTCGLYEVRLSLEMDEPPRQPPAAVFAMAPPPVWNNWKGSAVDIRRFWLRFPDQRRTKVFVPGWRSAVLEDADWSVRVRAFEGAALSLQVADKQDRMVGQVGGQSAGDWLDLRWHVPPLKEGFYTATLRVEGPDGAEQFRFGLQFVDPPPPDSRFQLIGHFSGECAGDEELSERVRTCLESFGLDTMSTGGMGQAAKLWDESLPRLEQPRSLRRIGWLDALVASRGQNLWTDFDFQMIVLATHGTSKPYIPTVPCVHHPDYESAVRARLAPALRFQAARAGLISTEIIDEPHLYPSNVCRCDICQRLYRERYGEEMPTWEAVVGDQTPRRWHLFQWLEDYSSRAFAATQRVKRELAPQLHLHNVAIDRLFSSNFMFNGMHRWAASGDEIYMACYPWSYLAYRGHRQTPHSQTHWIAGWIRGLAAHYGIPWGVFMEIWEHDVPNRWLPPYWSVGQFYALLAAGADRLDTFLLSFGSETFGISDVRLREFGFEVNKVRPFFPLLAQAKRPRARMAFVNPWCQWVMDPQAHYLPPDHEGYGYYRRYAMPFDRLYPNENRHMLAYELFHRTFSDLDQVDEQLLCEAPVDYDAVVVSDCRFLMRRTMETLEGFVGRGGVLVLDCEPCRDETGGTNDFYARLTGGAVIGSGILIPGLSYRLLSFGKGKVLSFSASLQTSYADAVEGERRGIRERLETGVKRLLGELGLVPRWETDCGDVDAGLRLTENGCLVSVANLGSGPREAWVRLRELPFVPSFAADMTEGSFIGFEQDAEGVRFHVALDSYRGALVALFADRPDRCKAQLAYENVRPGDLLAYDVFLEAGDGSAALGTFLVQATVTDSRGDVHPRLGGPIIVRNGSARFRKRLPVNAAPGVWTLSLNEPLIGLAAKAEFTVSAGAL